MGNAASWFRYFWWHEFLQKCFHFFREIELFNIRFCKSTGKNSGVLNNAPSLVFMIRRTKFLRLFLPCLFGLAPWVGAQTTVTTDPVGFTKITCLGNSDTIVSLPLTRPAEFVGTIQSVSGNVITITGSTAWTPNQFVYVSGTQPKTYYALIGSGTTANPKEGAIYTITANGANTLTLNLNGDSISAVPAGTSVSVIPYWTLNTVFPASDAGVSFTPSTSIFSLQTAILLPDTMSAGINLAPTKTYFFYNNAWRQFGQDASVDHGDDVLPPHSSFTIRNNGATSTTLACLGGVMMKKVMAPLATQTSTQQDNFTSIIRPIDVSLNNLGLISSGAFTASTSIFNLADELLVFDNTQTGINKSPSVTYFYYNGAWRKFGQDVTVDFGTDTIPAGSGFIIRKASTPQGSTVFWINDKTY